MEHFDRCKVNNPFRYTIDAMDHQDNETVWATMVQKHSEAVLRATTNHSTDLRRDKSYVDLGADLRRVMKNRWFVIYRCGLAWPSIPREIVLQAVAVLRYVAASAGMADMEQVREYVYGPRKRISTDAAAH